MPVANNVKDLVLEINSLLVGQPILRLFDSLAFPNPKPCRVKEHAASFFWKVLCLKRVQVLAKPVDFSLEHSKAT